MTHLLILWLIFRTKSFLIFWAITFVISWVLQRECFRREGKRVPRSAVVLVLILTTLIPAFNIVLSLFLLAVENWVTPGTDFSHFYLLKKRDNWNKEFQ